jgi:hypothetical protein
MTPKYRIRQVYIVEPIEYNGIDYGTEVSIDEVGHIWLKDFGPKGEYIDQYTIYQEKARLVADAILELTKMV